MITIIKGLNEFHNLRLEWNRLSDCFRSPLLRHEFFSACLAMGQTHSPMIFVSSDRAQVNAIAPLERVRQHGVSRLQSIGRTLHEPSGFLFRNPDALKEVLLAIRGSGYPLLLERVAEGEAEEKAVQDVVRIGDLLIRRDGGMSPYLSLRDGFEAFTQRLSSGRRADLRRKRRHAERIGPVEVHAVQPSADETDGYLDIFLQLEASGWKGRNGSAIINASGTENFFRGYASSLAAEGKLRLFFLHIDGTAAAGRLAIQHNNWLWELKIAYDEKLERCSPGMLLTYETIRCACDEGLDGIEFLGRVAAWNNFWGIQERPHSTIRYYPRGLRSGGSILSDAWLAAQQFRSARKVKKTTVPVKEVA